HCMGGTENYTLGLIHELRHLGVQSSVVVPRRVGAEPWYEYQGIQVHTIQGYAGNARELGARTSLPQEASAFRNVLGNGYAVYHQHAWTQGCSEVHLEIAKRLGLRTVYTVHTPSPICLRGTMVRFGPSQCDGVIEDVKCASCWAQSRGVGKAVAA